MQFLYPIGLLAFASVIVPIIIHLWNVKQGKTLKIGSIALLGESSRASSKSFKINDWLLLVLRFLLLIFAAIVLAQPFLKKQLAKKNSGWILIERSNFNNVFKANRKAIDSLTKLGYEIHDFNVGFNQLNPKDTSNTDTATTNTLNYNSLLNQLNNLIPNKNTVYLFADNRLKNIGNELPKISYKLIWNPLKQIDTVSNWSTEYNGKKFEAISKPSSTIYKAINSDALPIKVSVYEAPGNADKQYLLAALKAIASFSGRSLEVNTAGKADIGFWLSEEPVSVNFKSAIDTNGKLFQYAKGKIISENSFININGIKVASSKRIETAKSFDKIWTDGFGNTILSRQKTNTLNIFYLNTRLKPQWNQLVWNEVFVKAMMPIVFYNDKAEDFGFEKNAADQRRFAPKQIKFTQINGKALAAKKGQNESVTYIFWFIAFVIFIAERILSFRKKANVYVKN